MPKTIRLHVVGEELRAILAEVEYAEAELDGMEREGRLHPVLVEARQTLDAIRTAVLGEVTQALQQFGAILATYVLPARTPSEDPLPAIAEAAQRLERALFEPLRGLHELIERLDRETHRASPPVLLMAVGVEMYRAFGRIRAELAPEPASSAPDAVEDVRL